MSIAQQSQAATLSAVTEWEIAFGEYLSSERRASQHTVTHYLTDVRQLGAYLATVDEGLTWTDVDLHLMRNWVAQLMDEGIKASTANTKLSSIRAFFRFLLRTGRCTADRVRYIQGPKKGKPLPAFVRESEMNRLLDIMGRDTENFDSVRDRLIVLMFYLTGMRRAELLGLNLEDVDVAQCQLRVTGKRNKQRLLPFGTELQQAIQTYLVMRNQIEGADDRAFFINTKGVRLGPSFVTARVHEALSLVTTAKKRSPHVLRHTFATTMLNGGANLESVKELLGHESVATTEVYTHATFEHLRQVYQKSHPHAPRDCRGAQEETEKEEV